MVDRNPAKKGRSAVSVDENLRRLEQFLGSHRCKPGLYQSSEYSEQEEETRLAVFARNATYNPKLQSRLASTGYFDFPTAKEKRDRDRWFVNYGEMAFYTSRFGHLPPRSGAWDPLASWAKTQKLKAENGELSPFQTQLLNAISFFELLGWREFKAERMWLRLASAYVRFVEIQGRIPRFAGKGPAVDGISEGRLASWYAAQARHDADLSDEQKLVLDRINDLRPPASSKRASGDRALSSIAERALLECIIDVLPSGTRVIHRAQVECVDGTCHELDIYIPDLNIGIEYGCWFHHKIKVEKDAAKSRALAETGVRVITIIDQVLNDCDAERYRDAFDVGEDVVTLSYYVVDSTKKFARALEQIAAKLPELAPYLAGPHDYGAYIHRARQWMGVVCGDA